MGNRGRNGWLGMTAMLVIGGWRLLAEAVPAVTAPPEGFFEMVREADREAARGFYRKYIDVRGMPVVAAGVVADEALQRTHEIVSRMLAGRPDVIERMVSTKMYLIVIGRDQVYTDMPEYRNHPNPAFQNERVRGTGGRPTSFGEENVLSLPLDRYDDESIGVHEFCHTIDSALASLDPGWWERKNRVYRNAMEKGLWKFAYAASNPGEYWAEICQSYFDCNRANNWNHGPIVTREQLKAYDPEGYELVRTTFNLKPEQDWRYSYVQRQPTVLPPPARFQLDPWYTRFTWAREFTVVGHGASDEALLRANHVIRRLFAYRHDVLKALIADGVKLVVLGRGEKLADIPELARPMEGPGPDLLSRQLDYAAGTRLLVVGEESVMGDPRQPGVGDHGVIRAMALAAYRVTSVRPVDPNWDKRGREVQQYELRVQRLDVRFGARVGELHQRAVASGKWKGTAAFAGPEAYWLAGVLAYFDAKGQDGVPEGASHPVTTREALQAYDPDLFELVAETFAFRGRVDWRLDGR